MLKKDFIKLANQGNPRVSVNKIIKNFVGSPLQIYKILDKELKQHIHSIQILIT